MMLQEIYLDIDMTRRLQQSLPSLYTCETSGIVYHIRCRRCFMEYIGKTGRTLAKRFDEHRGYVRNKTKDPTGQHFNLMGHSISDMEVSVQNDQMTKMIMMTKMLNMLSMLNM